MANATPINVREAIINDYVSKFIGVCDLSKNYNLHRFTIQRYLKRAKVTLRKKTPQIRVNHFSFSSYNAESCYWAGFILADGYIRNNTLEIKQAKKDRSHLEKIKKWIAFEGEIKGRDNYYGISISSSQLINDLKNKFEIGNKKSLTCFISKKIPQKYLTDFIRGYFDGDGSITYTSTYAINVVGTYKTIDFIINFFYKKGIRLRSKDMPVITKVGNVFYTSYSGISAYKCLTRLYKKASVYLDRKFQLYLNLKLIYER